MPSSKKAVRKGRKLVPRDLHEHLLREIREMKKKQKIRGARSYFNEMKQIEISNRGAVGEKFVLELLTAIGKSCEYGGAAHRTNKHWDIRVRGDGVRLEVKTATLTKVGEKFQHEAVEKDRDWNGLIFLDIAPSEIYISCIAKSDVRWISLHKRSNSIVYKYDVALKELEGGHELREVADFERHYQRMLTRIRQARRKQTKKRVRRKTAKKTRKRRHGA